MTDAHSELPSREAVEKRAADYFQRQRFWDWSEADQAALEAWLAESVRHRIAYLRVESGDERMARLVAHGPPRLDVVPPRGASRRFAVPLLAAASVALAVTFGYPLARSFLEPPVRSFATEVGGRATFKFQDGTEVELNTNTAMHYRMATNERTVWLDRGEAYFRVAHNAANPFTVVAEGHRITDLGTEFLVRDDRGALDVALVKGRAQLRAETPSAVAAMLTPGDEAHATQASMTITRKSPRDIADELAWRRGVLVFRNTRLADAVREFNRYNATKLVIADPSIADIRVSAEIKTDHFDDMLQLAQSLLNLRVDRQGNDILISRRGPTAKFRVGKSATDAVR